MAKILGVTSDKGFRGGLKGHCHADFAVFWSKYIKYMTNYLCLNIKLLLEHQEDNIK